jgi:hypothetical protein
VAMFKVRYYKEKDQARLIQRMLIWQGYGCDIVEDQHVTVETGGKPSAVLYKHRTAVASGFFAAVEWFEASGLTYRKAAPPLNKDRVKSIPGKIKIKSKPAPEKKKKVKQAERIAKPADPFAVEETKSGPTF